MKERKFYRGNLRHKYRRHLLLYIYIFDHKGMGLFSNNERVFSDGFQIVPNLSKRLLTPAETSLLSKGLSFCPTPRDIDFFARRKDISDYVRRLR